MRYENILSKIHLHKIFYTTKRLTTFCALLALLHPLLSLTHWIFRSLILPYKSSSHSAKCVRCAPLRSGGRRLAVRTAMEHPIGALTRTPFPASRDFPSRGNEKIGGTGYCVTYDTDSQSRNAPCVPFRGRGPRSGEGVDGGNPDYDTRCGRDRRRRHYKTHRPAGDTTTLGPKARQT